MLLRCRPRGLSLVRIIVVLVVLLILLQLLHMSLLSKLEAKGTVFKHARLLEQRAQHESHTRNAWIRMQKKLSDTYVLDHSGEHQVLDNFLKAGYSDDTNIVSDVKEKLQYFNVDLNGFDVSITTQSSCQHLHHLIGLSKLWQGPISVSVFTFGKDIVKCIQTIAYLHLCKEHVKKHVTFHLVYPLSHPPQNLNFSHISSEGLCDRDLESVTSKTDQNYAIDGIKYPHNLLRNLAIKYTLTTYILMLDIDILPSVSLRKNFMTFIKTFTASNESENEPTAFVLPVFEVKANAPVPATKAELLASWNNVTVRPFYSDVCWKCQRHTNYERWKTGYNAWQSTPLQVSYYVYWKDPWEPFYIAKRNMPAYDERFKQYGFNRISQVCELHTAGYVFGVLNNAFLVHKGFKSVKGFHSSKAREQDENRVLFRQFKEELKTKYPESYRRC